MVDGVAALGIAIPKRAPAVELKTERESIIESCSPYFVGNNRDVMRRITGADGINLLRVYLALAGHARGKTGLCHPSQGRIATALGISRKTVTRSIEKLIERGLIKLEYKKPVKQGHVLVLRIIHDNSLSSADVQSIAGNESYPQAQMGHLNVSSVTARLSTAKLQMGHAPQKPAFTDGTQLCPSTDGTPRCPTELTEHKKTFNGQLETAEQAIEHWLAYAWLHGSTHPVANEQDLETAHALVAQGITRAELETAVVSNPESERLAPIATTLLS